MLAKIPLIGELRNSKRSSIIDAAKEMLYSTIFSTLPIWFFPVVSWLFLAESPSIYTNIYSTVNQGDLYIYSSSLVGPLIFAITYNYAEWGGDNRSPNASRIGKLAFEFPYGTSFFFISISICMIAAICFGLQRFVMLGLISAKLNIASMLTASIFLYVFSLVCLFCVSVYKNELANFSTSDSKNTKNFINEWNTRNG